MKYTERNGVIINSWKRHGALPWMQPITHEEYLRAAAGEELMTLTGIRKVPFSWYGDCRGKKVLGLAAGGGQQMAIMSALGAECTLLDITKAQIEADRMVSEREGYDIRLVKGDMTDPLPFSDESFDMVVNPISNHYVEEAEPVFREVYRVLAPGGTFLAGLDTGIYWAFEPDGNGIIHSLPHNPMKDRDLRKELFFQNEAYVFSHTLEEQIGGQLRAGFVLKEILEDTHEGDKFGENNIPTSILTRSVKPKS